MPPNSQVWECPKCRARHAPALPCSTVECCQRHNRTMMNLIEGEYPPTPKKQPIPSRNARPKAGRITSVEQLATMLKGTK